MKFDLRFPIGLLFSFYGLVLVFYGFFSNPEIYERSLNIDINLVWGIVMLVFGGGMLALAFRGRSKGP
jgi:hypothetical protein